MKNLINLFYFMFLPLLGFSQSASISGNVVDADEQAIYFANVIVNNAMDSSFVKVEYTDEAGNFIINGIAKGSYWVTINYVGLVDFNTPVFKLDANDKKDLSSMQLQAANNELSQVTVTAKRPLLELKPDKVILNVAGSINATGEDALSLIRKSPGVVVDNNDNINMLGKSAISVYINGKPSYLSGTDLANYLKSLSSDQIDAIEIITNPSAKYDAEGSGGIINIKLVKNKSHGANGSLSVNYAKGELSRSSANFNGNFRNAKWYAYTNTGIYEGSNINYNDLYRVQSGLIFDQKNIGQGSWKGLNTKWGLDHFIDDKHTLGVQLNFSPGKGDWNNSGYTKISDKSEGEVESFLVSEALNDWNNTDKSANLNYKFEGEDSRSLNIDLDYGKYNNDNEEFQPNFYLAPDSTTMLFSRNFYTNSPTEIMIATAKLDYEQNLFGGQVGLGVKHANVRTDNTFDFYNDVDGVRTLDLEQSNQFEYTEKVNAAYITYAKQFGKLGLQSGLRMEQTVSEGMLTAMMTSNDELVSRSYLDWFPNLGMSYQLNEKNNFNLSYSRRLNRPSYQDLNPFSSRLDELTYEQGNPFLNPEYTNNVQFSHSWNYKINTSIGYSHTTDLISRILDKVDDRSTNITWRNLDDQKSFTINISSPIPIKEWWNTYTSITGVTTRNKAVLENDNVIDLRVNTFHIYSQQSFSLPKDYSFEVSGWYASPSIWEGNVKMNSMYGIDLGLQKKFLDDMMTVKIGVSDIFRSTGWSGTSELGDLYMDISGLNDSRRLKLNVSYRFGNDQLKSRKRSTGIEDEKDRIKSDN